VLNVAVGELACVSINHQTRYLHGAPAVARLTAKICRAASRMFGTAREGWRVVQRIYRRRSSAAWGKHGWNRNVKLFQGRVQQEGRKIHGRLWVSSATVYLWKDLSLAFLHGSGTPVVASRRFFGSAKKYFPSEVAGNASWNLLAVTLEEGKVL
jgi:hypothetical protein